MVMDSFAQILDDERIGEIVIADVCSYPEDIVKLISKIEKINNPKIKLIVGLKNSGVYKNKMNAVFGATNEYAALIDSDNIFDKSYIDAIYVKAWQPDTILCPSFAKPSFDYRAFSGLTIDSANIKEYLNKPMFQCLLNTMNFFVNRNEYLKAWEENDRVNVADSIYFNYLWLKRGGKLYVNEGMEYQHTIHEGSNYKINCNNAGQITSDDIIKKF